MQLHGAIAAYQSDLALRNQTQEAMRITHEQWLNESTADLRGELCLYDQGEPLEGLALLQGLLCDLEKSTTFVEEFFTRLQLVLKLNPLGEVPLQHRSNSGFARMQLIECGGASLSLCAYEPVEAKRQIETAQFTDSRSVELVLSGEAQGALYSLCQNQGRTQIEQRTLHLSAGSQIACQPRRNARQFLAVGQSMLLLQLSRTPKNPAPSMQYRLSDGALLRQTSGNKQASEQVMALAVLGAMEHEQGIEAMVSFAMNTAQDRDARWEAVRQILAMNAQKGLCLLSDLSGESTETLQAPAAKLFDHLVKRNPALLDLVKEAV